MDSNTDNSGLTIIKASAGSGKTHRLTYEYLKLVLSVPQKFKNILTVTFTNKATAEMKSRIMEELQTIALNPSKSGMVEELSIELNEDVNVLSVKAKDLVKSILHQYAFFNVSTIDHFFQNVIRNLTKELGLNGGFRIQLDQGEIIEAAIEKFLQDLRQDDEQMKTMLEYIDSQMDDEKSWNVNRHLEDFTLQLFREQVRYFFIKNKGSLNGSASTAEIKSVLKQKINWFEKKTDNWIKSYDAIIEKADLTPDDFSGKSKNPLLSAKNKIEKKKYSELENNIDRILKQDRWSHKDSEKAQFVDSLAPEFDKLSEELTEIFNQDFPLYLEAVTLHKHIYQHALASGLMEKVSEILAEQNLFMLADAPVLLNLFTDGQDTPFIYEKSGRIFKHYMIDEFQDTSALQWENFKPLLQESLAEGNRGNFIVGDVKQAIYRWRNGDWALLHKKVSQQIQQSTTWVLKENWRSKENIILFNNLFFKNLIEIIGKNLPDQNRHELNEIYDDVAQKINEKIRDKRKGGYVTVKGIDVNKRNEFIENSLIELKKQVTLLKDTYQADDICILVRKNDELTAVSEFLINETNYEVISSGSLTLGSSSLLQIAIACIRFLNSPHDLYLKTIAFLLEKAKKVHKDISHIFQSENDEILPDNFTETIDSLRQKSILEIITEIINAFNLNDYYPNQEIFIARFYNELKQLIFDKGSNLQTVLDWWESKGEKMSIELTEANSSAIKVMTIHKSKGLQFQHVIVPFAQWAPSSKQDTLWLPGEAFSIEEARGGIFPVNLNKNHQFCEELAKYYEEEKFASQVDLINVLYVTNTRAIDGLHIFYHQNANSKNDIARYIDEIMKSENNLTEILTKKDENTYEYGSLSISKVPKSTKASKIKISFKNEPTIKVKSTKQSIYDPDIFDKNAAALGSFWHKIFEKITVKSDIKQAVYKQYDLGNINDKQAKIIENQISEWLNNEEVEQWFKTENRVLAETEIIIPKETHRRPDRVVIHKLGTDIIDYKFGLNENQQHKNQVSEYCQFFKSMGFNNVQGFIWYPFLNKIVKT